MFKLVNHNTGETHEFADSDKAVGAYDKINEAGRNRGFPDNFSVYDDDGKMVAGTSFVAEKKTGTK